jgi:hypothetical protein
LGGGDPGAVVANRMSRTEMEAEARKLGTQTASVAIANKELDKFIPLAADASDAVPRSAWRPLNALEQVAENTLSSAQKRLVIANRSVINAYAQLIQRGAPTVHSLAEAKDLLLTADSRDVYDAALDQLLKEGVNAEAGLVEARDDLMQRAQATGGGAAAAAPPGAASAPDAGIHVSQDAIQAEMKRRGLK